MKIPTLKPTQQKSQNSKSYFFTVIELEFFFFFSNKTWIQRELKEKIKNMCHLYSKSLKLCVFYALKIDLKTQHYFETCFYTNMLVNTIYYI